MSERVAIVTGAARGIGAATARRLAAGGWRLILVDSVHDDPALAYPLARPADLDQVVETCGGVERALAVVADVRDQAALGRAVASGLQLFGRLDAAVAAAGTIAGGTDGWQTTDATWDAMIDVNLGGVWRLSRAALPAILETAPAGAGRFVAVASAASQLGLPKLAAYCASKAGVVGLVRALAAELGPSGVTANAVAPGSTQTDILDASAAVYGLEGTAEFAQHHLLGRLLQPEEPAALITWLCGREAGGVTGAVFPIDAGMTAR